MGIVIWTIIVTTVVYLLCVLRVWLYLDDSQPAEKMSRLERLVQNRALKITLIVLAPLTIAVGFILSIVATVHFMVAVDKSFRDRDKLEDRQNAE